MVFLTKELTDKGFAQDAGAAPKTPPFKVQKPIESAEARIKREIRSYEDLLKKAMVQTDLVRAEAELKRAKGEKVPLKDEAKAKHARDMERFELYRQGKAQAEQFKNSDPERYEREIASWEDFKDDMSL